MKNENTFQNRSASRDWRFLEPPAVPKTESDLIKNNLNYLEQLP